MFPETTDTQWYVNDQVFDAEKYQLGIHGNRRTLTIRNCTKEDNVTVTADVQKKSTAARLTVIKSKCESTEEYAETTSSGKTMEAVTGETGTEGATVGANTSQAALNVKGRIYLQYVIRFKYASFHIFYILIYLCHQLCA